MLDVHLEEGDAAEYAELSDFLADWLSGTQQHTPAGSNYRISARSVDKVLVATTDLFICASRG